MAAQSEVDCRSILERFFTSTDPDYFRFRNRIRISWPGIRSVYGGVELFVDANGVGSARYSAGVRRTSAET
jgi:hypothetical protein